MVQPLAKNIIFLYSSNNITIFSQKRRTMIIMIPLKALCTNTFNLVTLKITEEVIILLVLTDLPEQALTGQPE